MMTVGCSTWNQTKVDSGVDLTTSTASAGRISPDGNLTAAYLGLGATIANVDTKGIYGITPGPVTTMAMPTPAGISFLSSPKNVRATGVKYTPVPNPGEVAFSAETIEINVSDVVTALTPALITAAQELKGMTLVEAEARVEQMKLAGEITANIAARLVELLPLIIGL